MSRILRQKIKIIGSGRTDKGVHAIQQIFHVDLKKKLPGNLDYKLNSVLPSDIALKSFKQVNEEAHARFSAEWRSYEYRMHQAKDPFLEGRSYFYHKKIDLKKMNEAALILLGEHDFKSFSKVKTDVKNFKCNIKAAYWHEEKNRIHFYITANRFLRGMVRAVTGTMLLVGENKITLQDFRKIISQKNRKKAGRNVPAHGLFLTKIEYPDEVYELDNGGKGRS